MVDYELSRRILRSFLGHNLKGEVFIGEIPSSIPIDLDMLSPINIIVSIVHSDSSYEIILEEENRDSENKTLLFLDYLRSNGWIEVSDQSSQSRRSFVDSKSQCLFSIKILVLVLDEEKTLYWITSRKNLPVRLNLFQNPQIAVQGFSNVLLPPNIHFDFKYSQQSLHKVATEAEFLEMSILKTDLSVLQLSSKYSYQLGQLRWKLCHSTNNDAFYASNWTYNIGDNIFHHLTLSINSLDVNDEYMVTMSIHDITWNNYLYFLTQAAVPQSKAESESIPTDLLQKIVGVFQEDAVSFKLAPENVINEYLPVNLPSGTEVIGSTLIDNKAIKIFANLPLDGLRSSSYITESFQALGWEPLSIVPFMSGKGFIDSGFNFSFPRFFFWPNAENGEKQISIRTFPLSGQWTDVEIDCGSKVFETVPCDELNSSREIYLEYPVLPSLQPYEDSFVECTSEFLDRGLFFSQAHLQSTSDIENLIAHYKIQLSTSGEWDEVLSVRDNRLFVSNWSAKDSENRMWLGIFLLADMEENSQDYLLQFTAFQKNKQKIKKQGFFNKIMGK
ncbi:MAG: hypothetical protein HC936_04050 [Leptolyngbyaceae cyanobacterium SU_3_3]|nr:hypothetical protein [Leptolyngbyaceae cyanobacterium SU_3_3]